MQVYERIAYITDKAKINDKISRHEIPEGFYRKWTIRMADDILLEADIQVKRLQGENTICQCIVFDDETPVASTEPKPFVPDEISIYYKGDSYNIAIVDSSRTVHEICKKAVNIEYNTDKETQERLPKEIDIPMYEMDEDAIRSYITDLTRIRPKAFKIKEPPVHPPKNNV